MNEINIDEMMKESREIFCEENQLEAVKYNGDAIRYIHNPSEQVQIEAVKQNGNAIQYIANPSEQVQQAALKRDKDTIQFFKKAWRKDIAKKLTVEQIEKMLGYKVEIVSDQK